MLEDAIRKVYPDRSRWRELRELDLAARLIPTISGFHSLKPLFMDTLVELNLTQNRSVLLLDTSMTWC